MTNGQKNKWTRWVIIGECGLYVGQYLTRNDAIADHVKDKFGVSKKYARNLTPEQIRHWRRCKQLGDRAVRARISLV